jgi:hypothetical protein
MNQPPFSEPAQSSFEETTSGESSEREKILEVGTTFVKYMSKFHRTLSRAHGSYLLHLFLLQIASFPNFRCFSQNGPIALIHPSLPPYKNILRGYAYIEFIAMCNKSL